MAKLLGNLTHTVIAGVVLLIVVLIIMGASYQGVGLNLDKAWWATLMRWGHIISGVMWIGLLYYFNFVQTPTMPKLSAEQRPTIIGFILPEALFWFRWGAMSTLFFGLIVAWMNGYLGDAYALGLTSHQPKHTMIGIGMWLATIMWFNVWFIIWPNQKIVMGMVQKTPDERAKAGRVAGQTSRINAMLSIPMLFCMASSHTISLV
jgi:uncharacterized membrane protein